MIRLEKKQGHEFKRLQEILEEDIESEAAPDYNALTRLTPNLYANHMVAVNITNY